MLAADPLEGKRGRLECFGHVGPGERNKLEKAVRDRLVASDRSRRWAAEAGTDGECRCSVAEGLAGSWGDLRLFY